MPLYNYQYHHVVGGGLVSSSNKAANMSICQARERELVEITAEIQDPGYIVFLDKQKTEASTELKN